MAIAVACECGHGFEVRDELRGRKFKCPKCSQPVRAGKSSNNGNGKIETKKPKSDLIAIACNCGKRIAAKREWAGKRVKCPGCGESVRIPGGSADRQPASAASNMDDLLDEVGVSRAAHRCPECRSEMAENHVICTNCGYDIDRGKKLRTKTYQSSARKLDMHAGAMEKKPNLLLRVALLVVVLAVLATAAVLVPKFLG